MNGLWPLTVQETAVSPRHAIVEMPVDWLFDLLLPPEGMSVVGVYFNPQNRHVSFVVEHPNIYPVPPGAELSRLTVLYTRYEGTDARVIADWIGLDLKGSAKPADDTATGNRKKGHVAQTDHD